MDTKIKNPPRYKSATCALGNAVDMANKWDAEGYEVKWCIPTVVVENGERVNAIYMLASLYD